MGVGGTKTSYPERAYYPSGPRLDGKRSSDEYSPPSSPPVQKLPNPDPNNYKVIQAEQIGTHLVLKINYPDCTNFEGNKILVFRDMTAIDLLNQKLIDPHFFNHTKYKSPIARFVPTNEGWSMAVSFAKMLEQGKLK